MAYVDGFFAAVPAANQESYRKHALQGVPLFQEFGATRQVETWGDDVPDGKLTDCRRAVLATADETVVFGRVEWPSKAVRDAAWPKVFADPRMHPTDLPIDNNRRIWGGFVPLLDE